MELKEAIKQLKEKLKQRDEINKIKDEEEREIEKSAYFEEMPFEAIDTVLEELDKKDKVIDLMACDLFLKDDLGEYDEDCFEDIKKYFYKKVEKENE